MNSKLYFIHGFGEKPNIFDKIACDLSQNAIFIDNWDELGNIEKKKYTAFDYANDLHQKYQITENDTIIGHSLGGWIAYHLKYVSGAKAIQIASWTDMDRVRFPINNYNIIRFLVKHGLTFNRFSRQYFINKHYSNLPSKDIFVENYNRLSKGNKINVLNQINLILHGKHSDAMPEPDLRIHSLHDRLIRPPKQDFYKVAGDHFNLITHPEEVVNAIKTILGN